MVNYLRIYQYKGSDPSEDFSESGDIEAGSDKLNRKYTENINFLKIGRFWLWGAIAVKSWEDRICRDLYLYKFGVH